MCKSPAMTGTAGVFFASRITGLESNRNLPSKFLGCSSACTVATSIPEVVSDLPFASASSSSTAGASGWSIPCLAEDQPSASPSPHAADNSQPEESLERDTYTVLLVEDSPTDVFVIREVLSGCQIKFRVDVVKDGQEALRYLHKSDRCPALVLLDLNIPKVDGFQVLHELRSGSKCHRTPVIVVSSSRADEDRSTAEQLGANAYFQKPGDLESYSELRQVVEDVLGRPGIGF